MQLDLALYQQQLEQFLQAGGPVLYALVLLAVALWSLLLERHWFIFVSFPNQLRACRDAGDYSGYLHLSLDAKLALQRSVPMIKTLIALCPLLGLLGTVIGMIQLFDVLAIRGTGNPRLMAAGVARATLPTMAGMVLAVTGLLLYGRIQRWTQRQQQKLMVMNNFWRGH